jgi:hypothetical protein
MRCATPSSDRRDFSNHPCSGPDRGLVPGIRRERERSAPERSLPRSWQTKRREWPTLQSRTEILCRLHTSLTMAGMGHEMMQLGWKFEQNRSSSVYSVCSVPAVSLGECMGGMSGAAASANGRKVGGRHIRKTWKSPFREGSISPQSRSQDPKGRPLGNPLISPPQARVEVRGGFLTRSRGE